MAIQSAQTRPVWDTAGTLPRNGQGWLTGDQCKPYMAVPWSVWEWLKDRPFEAEVFFMYVIVCSSFGLMFLSHKEDNGYFGG